MEHVQPPPGPEWESVCLGPVCPRPGDWPQASEFVVASALGLKSDPVSFPECLPPAWPLSPSVNRPHSSFAAVHFETPEFQKKRRKINRV